VSKIQPEEVELARLTLVAMDEATAENEVILSLVGLIKAVRRGTYMAGALWHEEQAKVCFKIAATEEEDGLLLGRDDPNSSSSWPSWVVHSAMGRCHEESAKKMRQLASSPGTQPGEVTATPNNQPKKESQ
jgi:hypothetical protein